MNDIPKRKRTSFKELENELISGQIKQGNYIFEIDDFILIVRYKNFFEILSQLQRLQVFLNQVKPDLFILVEPKDAPQIGVSEDDIIGNIVFNSKQISIDLDNLFVQSMEFLCYYIVKRFIDSKAPFKILVNSFDDIMLTDLPIESIAKGFDVVIPHQGDLDYITKCLTQISACAAIPENINVYFDEPITQRHVDIVKAHPSVVFRSMVPHNVGPYVAKNHCIDHSSATYICYQDSDDIPTYDRFACFVKNTLEYPGFDLVGSHELRINELSMHLMAVRYAKDVSMAMTRAPAHSQLHPTTFIKRSQVIKAGKFSTFNRFGLDTQFLLRASLSLRIANVDKFLYIRRKRDGSLTTTPETKLGSPERMRLGLEWRADLEKVRSGEMVLEDSAIAPKLREKEVEFKIL